MVVQYELSQATAKQAPLFNYVDIHHILTSNLGLRLSHRPDEITDGGFGRCKRIYPIRDAQRVNPEKS